MRYLLFLVAIASCLVLGFQSTNAQAASTPAVQQKPEANIAFEWAFGALIGKDKQLASITRDTSLQSGEEIKMYVRLLKDCFVYVVYYGPKGEVSLLFPSETRQFQQDYMTEKNYFIPAGRTWIKLDENAGPEKFFLVASTQRLLDLEVKINNYISATDASQKKELAEGVVSEIRNVRKQYTTFATLAEKPITIGGNIRDIKEVKEVKRPDVSTIATKITANNFYSKTITIDHK
jgi:hypothetical protein